jgi:triphosphoribosyl-dephospho-CoA synthase
VHRGADFEDSTFTDFLVSAVAVGPIIARAADQGVGSTVREAVAASLRFTGRNTNLGTVLLLAPLAAVAQDLALHNGIGAVLTALTPQDSAEVYAAIRLAKPGGLGRVERMDVAGPPPTDLLAAMQDAAPRDLVARQFCNRFEQVLQLALPWLIDGNDRGWPLTDAIVHTQIRLLDRFPDSLIARKCGPSVAQDASHRATAVLNAGPPGSSDYAQALADFDFWLRLDGHRRNPGTTADLIAAALFAGLRDRLITAPYR